MNKLKLRSRLRLRCGRQQGLTVLGLALTFAAVAQVEGMRLNATQARQFATSASLALQNVAELPIPVPPNQPSTPGAAGAAGNRSTTGSDR